MPCGGLEGIVILTRAAIGKIVAGESLAQEEAEEVMNEIMQGEATPSQIGAFLMALRMKGETTEEIAGCAMAMRDHCLKVPTKQSRLVDTCGTGGDVRGTFNISTVTAFVVSGAGLAVAKHGNRSVSSNCGSADVLEATGIKIEQSPEQIGRCIDEVGIGFLFAPGLHPAMKHAVGPRREIGVRTIFNILGPLTNPASASIQLLGVYTPELTETMAKVLRLLGTERAWVVHGAEGLDELSIAGVNKVTQLWDGEVKTFRVDPGKLGLSRGGVEQLRGGSISDNVAIMRDILQGRQGTRRDIVLLNASAVLTIAGITAGLKEGIAIAADAIDKGHAFNKMEQLLKLSQTL